MFGYGRGGARARGEGGPQVNKFKHMVNRKTD